MKQCQTCNFQNNDVNNFCQQCGKALPRKKNTWLVVGIIAAILMILGVVGFIIIVVIAIIVPQDTLDKWGGKIAIDTDEYVISEKMDKTKNEFFDKECQNWKIVTESDAGFDFDNAEGYYQKYGYITCDEGIFSYTVEHSTSPDKPLVNGYPISLHEIIFNNNELVAAIFPESIYYHHPGSKYCHDEYGCYYEETTGGNEDITDLMINKQLLDDLPALKSKIAKLDTLPYKTPNPDFSEVIEMCLASAPINTVENKLFAVGNMLVEQFEDWRNLDTSVGSDDDCFYIYRTHNTSFAESFNRVSGEINDEE